MATDFNATSDREKFDHGLSPDSLPVFSGRSFNIWTLEAGEIFAWANPSAVEGTLLERFSRQAKLKSSPMSGLDLQRDLSGKLPFQRARISYRSVARPTDSRTVIAALIPPGAITTHISPYVLTKSGNERLESYLLGLMCSLPFDWYARRFVETAVDKFLLNAFPVPDWLEVPVFQRIAEIACRLAAQDDKFSKWAGALGYSPSSVDEDEKAGLVAELDGLAALVYGLNESQLEHIYGTFHRGWSDESRLEIAVAAMREWSSK